ncbi:hypothetical protein [Arenibaculum pallidiluteum]|uniref:hypothetical protein n=1 Tax=Arenibaculum pallidiluteum TaxID=2812559 RepID=UPI001A966382|nr:hypothetical protein [Arenibaculum pallidiluteum]
MSRRGRKRNPTVLREPNGRPSRAQRRTEPAMTAELLARRAERCGAGVDPLDARAGTVLGLLLLRGWISERQHDGGCALAGAWRRWARLAESPDRHPRSHRLDAVSSVPPDAMPLDPPPCEPPDEAGAWRRADRQMRAFRAALPAPRALALALAESVCMDETMPARLGPGWPDGLVALRGALDTAAEAFGVARPARAAPAA